MRIPNLKKFKKYKEKAHDSLPGIKAEFFKRKAGTREESVGIFSHKGKVLYSAWGFIDEPHCRFNAVQKDNGTWYATRKGCPQKTLIKKGQKIVGFKIKTQKSIKTFSLL